MKLKNPKDAIGHKIIWNSWDDGSYFILEDIRGKNLHGILHTKYDGLSHNDKFVIGSGIKYKTTGSKNVSYWYLIEELRTFKLSKLDDGLFEI